MRRTAGLDSPISIPMLVVLLLTLVATAQAELTLPQLFGDNMVLQREAPIPVWGWASPGQEVKVTLGDNSAAAVAGADGRWRVEFPPMEAGGPHQVTITAGEQSRALENVLIGEVWLCAGQSNMQWSILVVRDAEQEIQAANYPRLRLFNVPVRSSGVPADDVAATWRVCSPATIAQDGGFPAVPYFFGRKLHQDLDVPVAVIAAAWGGTRIEGWIPPEGYASNPALADYLLQIEQAGPKFRDDLSTAVPQYESWLPEARRALDAGERVPDPPLWPRHPLDSAERPTGIYNGMIHPLVPFALRGAIWYQGESNAGDGMMYFEKMKALIAGWRQLWGRPELPFYYVQIAPCDLDPLYAGDALPELWEAQTAVMRAVPHTGMAVISDVGDLHDIHPRNKQEVGRRLALWALAETYGRDDIVPTGPIYRSLAVEANRLRIEFDYVGQGLSTRDGKDPDLFEVAGADGQFVPARADIVGDAVVVWSDDITTPTAVRFAWSRTAVPNLMNQNGLPASPFRARVE
ncbi:MAG: hypothetical protein BWZ08_01697 [candidate division BRC1 bacterium ADurb.BinA292]|nr:MAG: hypothetical protein BWZ08_01697 [candidate division BRC1 bacterium ADurb.BinA292]